MAENKFILPEAESSESAVIGSILLDQNAYKRIEHIIKPSDFYHRDNRVVFETMQRLWKERKDIDTQTVVEDLKMRGELDAVGGAARIVEVTNDVATVAHVVTHARIIAERSIQRRILSAAKKIAAVTQEDIEVDEMIPKVEELMKGATRDSAHQLDKLNLVNIQDFVDEAISSRPQRGQVHGLSTGFFTIDDMTKGFVPGELMVLSGHTSHGKTQLATNIAYNVAKSGKPVLFVTMEMTKVEMTQRILSIADDKIDDTLPIYFQSRTDLAYVDVAKLVERGKEKGVELVIIDHLHYFSRSIDNATAEISKIVKEFKQAAIENNMPVILICHVRKMDTKKRAMLQDLRDSSLIAQDSDMVLMVWRDTSPNAQTPDEVEVLLLKNRNRGLHRRRGYLYSQGSKLSEKQEERTVYNPDAIIEGGARADTDIGSW